MIYVLNKLTSGHAVEFCSCCEYAEDTSEDAAEIVYPFLFSCSWSLKE